MNKHLNVHMIYIYLPIRKRFLQVTPQQQLYSCSLRTGQLLFGVVLETFLSLSLSVLQCYLFHMYVGVRAGGGIGDEIEDPAGDEYELYRVVFDITFFFFVIVILLAIIQGVCCSCWFSERTTQDLLMWH